MNEWLQNLIAQIRELPPGGRLALLLSTAGSVAFFLWLVVGAGSPEYRSLYRGLAEDETGRVAEALRAENIDYQLADGGTGILVPAAMVYEARIRVASQGLPRGSASGFELFDRPGFGVTDFVHRVNFTRALQGELARSVEQLDPVERARVQVVIPERRSVIAAKQRRPSAAVVVQLRPGHSLDTEQVRAVVHLVASSIESLQPGEVTVVDGAGHLLAPQGDVAAGARAPGGAPAHQARVEAELAERIESILEKTAGPGSVVARVRADMDWTESETTEERYDPDSQVARSEHRMNESSADGSGGEGGIPGIASNAPDARGAAAVGGAAGSNASRSEETVNYEISKTVSRRTTPMGRIQRLSIAVLLAEPTASGEDGEEGSGGWEPGALESFEQLARQAVGFDEQRGDQITVTSAPFRRPDADFEAGGGLDPETLLLISNVVRALAVLLGLFAFGRFVLSPVLGAIGQAAPTGLPARVSDLEAQLAAGASSAPALGEGAGAGSAAGARSDDSVNTIRNWLAQG